MIEKLKRLKERLVGPNIQKADYKRECDYYVHALIQNTFFLFLLSIPLIIIFSIYKNADFNLVLSIFTETSDKNIDSRSLANIILGFGFILGSLLPLILFSKLNINVVNLIMYDRKKDKKFNLKAFFTSLIFSVCFIFIAKLTNWAVFFKYVLMGMGSVPFLCLFISSINMIAPKLVYKYLKLKKKHCKVVR